MKTYLNVPYSEKDAAKALGARWNPKVRKWYATDKCDLTKFIHWLPREIREMPKMRVFGTTIGAEYIKSECNCIPWIDCSCGDGPSYLSLVDLILG